MQPQISKWNVSPNGRLAHPGALKKAAPLRIVYLDDHTLYRRSLTDYCIKPFFTNIELIDFTDGNTAINFISNQLREDNKLNLIISDINHPGLKGNELAFKIRYYENLYKRFRTPIMILSMVDEMYCPELKTKNIVDGFLSKAAEIEDVIDCLEELLYVIG